MQLPRPWIDNPPPQLSLALWYPSIVLFRAKDHISPGNHISPPFSMIILSMLKQIFVVSLNLLGKNYFHWNKRKKSISSKKKKRKKNYRKFKISGEIWSPGGIWFFALYVCFLEQVFHVIVPVVCEFGVSPWESINCKTFNKMLLTYV